MQGHIGLLFSCLRSSHAICDGLKCLNVWWGSRCEKTFSLCFHGERVLSPAVQRVGTASYVTAVQSAFFLDSIFAMILSVAYCYRKYLSTCREVVKVFTTLRLASFLFDRFSTKLSIWYSRLSLSHEEVEQPRDFSFMIAIGIAC